MTKQSLPYDLLFAPRLRILRHLLLVAILAVIAFNHVFQAFADDLPALGDAVYLLGLGFLALYLIAAYLNLYLLVPSLLLRKRYASYLPAFLALMLLLLAGKLALERVGCSLAGNPLSYAQTNPYDNISYLVINTLCIAGISMTAFLNRWMDDGLRIGRLERGLLQTEVDRMKEQINPRLLCDILTAASASAKTDADKASDMLLRLSELLRYELYDCNRERVLLGTDLQFIANYLKLEQLHAPDFEYTLCVEGKTDHLFIPPLLLMPLVQKVLAQVRKQRKTALRLSVSVAGGSVRFRCSTDPVGLSRADFQTAWQRLQMICNESFRLDVEADFVELQLMTPGHAE